MRLPRWTTYPALATIAALVVTAVPEPVTRPAAGAAARARAGLPVTEHPRLVVLGIDGMDPDILRDVVARYPERMPHFRRLIEEADGVRDLGTSTPPQSPVAWSNFITGRNPGGHGIYDFIHRSTANYGPIPATVTETTAGQVDLPGAYRFPTSSGGDSNRSGKAFWTLLGEAGVPADVWRMPINFPVEPGRGWSFPGMMTPAVDSAYGEPTLYTSEPELDQLGQEKVVGIEVRRGVARTYVLGPENAFKDPDVDGHLERSRAPMDIFVDEDAGAVAVQVDGGAPLVLTPGQWSGFVPVTFSMLPLGLSDMGGIVRFYLRGLSPLEIYASPVNVDPRAPIQPVSAPDTAAVDLADLIGLYYTQGMAEDVNGLKNRMLTDAEFMMQASLVYEERGRMLDVALDHYMAKEDGGLLFFYYSSVDLAMHMMWRHADPEHPHHDEDFAADASDWWSGREGSVWREVIDDLYLRMDPILGRVRERVGEDTPIVVMSDHGFAPYRRKFSLNTWLLENGYLVLKEEFERELPEDSLEYSPVFIQVAADWSKTRAYGVGFNGLYLNLAGRESEGCVQAGESEALLAEIKAKLEALTDEDGSSVILRADPASAVYTGERLAEAPDLLVGYEQGYGNSDEASLGQIPHAVLSDNLGGTFNGSHLMAPDVVLGTLLASFPITLEDPRLEDLTVSILRHYGLEPDEAMDGRDAFQ
jgi:predicted AlkP superfamily phosphohydrolase/phosphomutase